MLAAILVCIIVHFFRNSNYLLKTLGEIPLIFTNIFITSSLYIFTLNCILIGSIFLQHIFFEHLSYCTQMQCILSTFFE